MTKSVFSCSYHLHCEFYGEIGKPKFSVIDTDIKFYVFYSASVESVGEAGRERFHKGKCSCYGPVQTVEADPASRRQENR